MWKGSAPECASRWLGFEREAGMAEESADEGGFSAKPWCKSITYAEGSAGAGIYEGGEPGSAGGPDVGPLF